MINLTRELLENLCRAYPYNPIAHGLDAEMDYPLSRFGFILGTTPDNTCLCVVLDIPASSDNKVFQKFFKTKVFRLKGYTVVLVQRAKNGDVARHQVLFGAFVDELASRSIGFKSEPVVHTQLKVSSSNIHNDTVVLEAPRPSGVFLELSQAYPCRTRFKTPIDRTKLLNSVRFGYNIELCRTRKYEFYTGKYVDIQHFLPTKKLVSP